MALKPTIRNSNNISDRVLHNNSSCHNIDKLYRDNDVDTRLHG